MKAAALTIGEQLPAAERRGALLDRADLMFCLSRAFLPPPAGMSVCDWGGPLADDLADLGDALGLDTSAVRAALAAECRRWTATAANGNGGADSWLVEYTRLFLVPPVVVPLNAGLYLEGSLSGSVAQMMRSCYQSAGITPDDTFRDLPDHASMQLEFVARLLERATRGDADADSLADEFCMTFIAAWSGPLQQACGGAEQRLPAASVYRALAGLLRDAVSV